MLVHWHETGIRRHLPFLVRSLSRKYAKWCSFKEGEGGGCIFGSCDISLQKSWQKSWQKEAWQKMHASITRARVTYMWGGVFCHALVNAITASVVCLHLLVPPLVQCCFFFSVSHLHNLVLGQNCGSTFERKVASFPGSHTPEREHWSSAGVEINICVPGEPGNEAKRKTLLVTVASIQQLIKDTNSTLPCTPPRVFLETNPCLSLYPIPFVSGNNTFLGFPRLQLLITCSMQYCKPFLDTASHFWILQAIKSWEARKAWERG